ncbi:hypothetical protein SAMN05660909_01760 [Chitinophaga terrae (ex Kim and Jung 2007)]|uniref:Uncharacterized protein n=1 Tax=Chitinophaga terrae (ex Kim and Jung 2007) TaxID=408074 RepID=A0A1H4ATL1_9BACT|nr:hypothetical protein [Chitinophaga terrae (ex Kim and Jung 2007)]MDQ0106751.1 hypothetical protein [Chitinophaga terrae (ex Kim and Jung 2007)]SEA39191.1 hypothetical protein SAMN05660909_01760 [Chitinophaga terrae (ex Kim and Jung 2007)]
MLFSIVLLLHFFVFASYIGHLGILWPTRGGGPRSRKGMIMGLMILVTGILLVLMKYPHVNYYKVVPKTAAFLLVTVINIRFGNRPYTPLAYYTLLGLALLAAGIAVYR